MISSSSTTNTEPFLAILECGDRVHRFSWSQPLANARGHVEQKRDYYRNEQQKANDETATTGGGL